MWFLRIALLLLIGTLNVTTISSLEVTELVSSNEANAGTSRMLRVSSLMEKSDTESRAASVPMLSSLKDKVTKVSDSMIQMWKQVQGKSANAAFVLLRLNTVEDLFASRRFALWVKYMTLVNRKDPEGAIVTALTTRYGDEVLAKMLEAAVKVPRPSNIVSKLQTAQMQGWITKEKSVDDIFDLFKLDQGVNKMLTNPSLDTFVTYLNMFNQKNPGKETTLIYTMTTSYGDELLAKGLEAAKHVPSTNKMATDLQTAQFKMWYKGGAKQDQIWKMLNMNKDTWMTNPDRMVWVGYKDFIKQQKNIVTS